MRYRLVLAILNAFHQTGRAPDDRFEVYASADEMAEWIMEACEAEGIAFLDRVPLTRPLPDVSRHTPGEYRK